MARDAIHIVTGHSVGDLQSSNVRNVSFLFSLSCSTSGYRGAFLVTKVTCHHACKPGRCFGPSQSDCCHDECVGGCRGRKSNQCTACRTQENDGECVHECPSAKIYDKTLFEYVPNPNVKFSYGGLCLKECPDFMLQDDTGCVRDCPADKVVSGKKCVPCDGPCPKRTWQFLLE